MTNLTAWFDTWQQIQDSYPDWKPNDTEAAHWRKALADYNQEWVREAVARVYETYSSSPPKLKWVRDAFWGVKRDKGVSKRAAKETHTEQMAAHCAEVERCRESAIQFVMRIPDDERERIRNAIFADYWGKVHAKHECNHADDPSEWKTGFLYDVQRAATTEREAS